MESLVATVELSALSITPQGGLTLFPSGASVESHFPEGEIHLPRSYRHQAQNRVQPKGLCQWTRVLRCGKIDFQIVR